MTATDRTVASGGVEAATSEAVRALRVDGPTVPVSAVGSHTLSHLEELLLETEALQRMRRLRQTGFAYFGLPTSEHSRLAHSLGTTYWAVRMLDRMRAGDRREVVRRLDEDLGPDLDLELLLRCFSLVHDSALLPLGHTLCHQLGYASADDVKSSRRLQQVLTWIGEDLTERLPDDIARTVVAHLDLMGTIMGLHGSAERAQHPAALQLVSDLVLNTVCADLMDFCDRDLAGASIGRAGGSQALADATVCLAGGDHPHTFGFDGRRDGEARTDVFETLGVLLRARHSIIAKIAYHPTKLAADAMLDKAVAAILATTPEFEVDSDAVLGLGDDELVAQLASLERQAATGPGFAGDLAAGRLVRQAYRLDQRALLSDAGRRLVDDGSTAAGRRRSEATIAAACGLDPDDLIFSVRPESMQEKPPDVLIRWTDDEVVWLEDLMTAEPAVASAIGELTDYRREWSASVYVHSRATGQIAAVRDAATRVLVSSPSSIG